MFVDEVGTRNLAPRIVDGRFVEVHARFVTLANETSGLVTAVDQAVHDCKLGHREALDVAALDTHETPVALHGRQDVGRLELARVLAIQDLGRHLRAAHTLGTMDKFGHLLGEQALGATGPGILLVTLHNSADLFWWDEGEEREVLAHVGVVGAVEELAVRRGNKAKPPTW